MSGHGTFSIRPATVVDLPAAAELMRRTVEEDFGTPYDPAYHRDINDLAGSYLEPPRHTLLVAIDDATGEVVGTGGIRVGRLRGGPEHLVRRYAGDDTAQLVRVYVRRDQRRRGTPPARGAPSPSGSRCRRMPATSRTPTSRPRFFSSSIPQLSGGSPPVTGLP